MNISIIIPSYKPGEYIWECFESLQNQSCSSDNFEVIVVLNGDKEPYYQRIENYLRGSKLHYKLIYTDIKGVSNARNLGIENSNGEYIAFIDDDDYVSSNYLESLYNNASIDTISLSNTIAFDNLSGKVDDDYSLTKCFKDGQIISFFGAKSYFNGPCMKLIHREIINSRKFDTILKNGEDSLFMFTISDKIKYCKFTQKDAIYYRRYRNDSAHYSKKSKKVIINNHLLVLHRMIYVYISNISNYNLIFFANRFLATIKGLFLFLKK